MQLRNRGNVVAIALSVLALAVAGSGTAVAVTSTTTISDPTTPSRIAHVDAQGRLTTVGAPATLNVFRTTFPNQSGGDAFVVSPTTATLAVTKLAVTAGPGNSATYSVTLLTAPVNSDGTCNTTTALRDYSSGYVAPGGAIRDDYAAPLSVARPTGVSKYCLDVFAQSAGGTASSGDILNVQLTGYVTAGAYTGAGAADDPATSK